MSLLAIHDHTHPKITDKKIIGETGFPHRTHYEEKRKFKGFLSSIWAYGMSNMGGYVYTIL